MGMNPSAIQDGIGGAAFGFLIAATPASLAATTAREDSFVVPGSLIGDTVIINGQILPAIAIGYSGGRVGVAGTVLAQVYNQSAGALVMTATTFKVTLIHA
jgi:hypothetical protein